jgi:4,5-dihydroxyphthalate decarboxylase
MSDLDLTLAMADYDRTTALRLGTVKPEGISLRYLISPPSETFWRMLKFNEFDASEMSLSSMLIARAQGREWTAIPVFPFRAFFHTSIFVRADSDIARPEDLAGRRFGLPEYQVTAAVWVRGTLQHEFGVPPSAIKWFIERKPGLSHGGTTGFTAPAGVSVDALAEGETLASALAKGDLDAVMGSPYPGMKSKLNATDQLQMSRSSQLRLLFPDPVAEGVRYFKKNGFSHINHTVVVQDAVLRRHPWVAINLVDAFTRSKQVAEASIDRLLRSGLIGAFGHLHAQRQVFGDDAFPYGLRSNREALRTLAGYEFEQGLIPQPVQIDDLFAESTRAL